MSFREGTRRYSFFEKVAVSSTSAQSAALTECDEVLLCATKAMWVTLGSDPTATTSNSIPLIAGEKFHLRVTPGYKIAAIRDSEDGSLVICRSN
jgi:hypothetical protein